MKTWYRIVSVLVVLGMICSACTMAQRSNNSEQGEAEEGPGEPLQVYIMGMSNVISSSGEERTEYSTQVTLGLERTTYMPGYAQGNAIYQALVDYEETTKTPVEVTFFDNPVDIMAQTEEAARQGSAPDLVLINKQFENDWNALAQEGTFADLSPYLQLDAEQYFTPVLRSGVWEEKQYIVPLLFNVNGFVTSEEFLSEIGQTAPSETASYEELIRLFQEACIQLQGDTSKVALYEGTTIWETYIINVLTAAAGYNNLEEKMPLSDETVTDILELMRDFLVQDLQTVPDYESQTIEENLSAQSLYDRFNFGPLYAEDPTYKREMLGILLDGGSGGHLVNSSFIMQVYALQTYYKEMNEQMVWGGIPLADEAGKYAACVNLLGFCPAQADNVEGAAKLLQYMLDYDYAPELGIAVNRETVEEDLAMLQQTSMQLYIQPQYNPFSDERAQQEIFNQSKVVFNPMEEKVAERLLALLDHVVGASLPQGEPAQTVEAQLEAQWNAAAPNRQQ